MRVGAMSLRHRDRSGFASSISEGHFMTSRSSRRHRLLVAGAALCCGPLLTLPAAQAATTGWDTTQSDLVGISSAGLLNMGAQCTATGGGFNNAPTTSQQHLVPNVAKSFSASSSTTATNTNDPTDQVTMASKAAGTGKLLQSGGRVTGVDLTFNGSTTAHATKPNPVCEVAAESAVGVAAVFNLDRPTVVTIDATSRGAGGLEVGIEPGSQGVNGSFSPGDEGSVFSIDMNPSTEIHRSTWLPAGQFTMIAAGVVLQIDSSKSSTTGSGNVHISFGAPGSRVSKTGSSKWVKMPASRSCATGTIRPRITGKRKLAKKIKHVVFTGPHFVDRLARNTHKGHTIKLHSNNSAPVEVHVRVRLRNGKLVDSTASYRPCVDAR